MRPDPACISLPTASEGAMLPHQLAWSEMRVRENKPGLKIGYQMFWQSIKRKIVSIALGLIILMVITSVLSIIMANKVDYLLNELTTKYIAAYGHLARTNIRSLELRWRCGGWLLQKWKVRRMNRAMQHA